MALLYFLAAKGVVVLRRTFPTGKPTSERYDLQVKTTNVADMFDS